MRKYKHNDNKSKHGTFKKSKDKGNSANTEGGKIQSRRKGESHRDAFRPCSRVSSDGRTSWETNSKSRTEEKDRSATRNLILLRLNGKE